MPEQCRDRQRRWGPIHDLRTGEERRRCLAGTSLAAVRLAVDLTRCQGYAQCCFLAPEVFQLAGQEALLYVPEPSEDQRAAVLRSVAACPVRAIQVDDVAPHPGAAD
jgi:ferredoxin